MYDSRKSIPCSFPSSRPCTEKVFLSYFVEHWFGVHFLAATYELAEYCSPFLFRCRRPGRWRVEKSNHGQFNLSENNLVVFLEDLG